MLIYWIWLATRNGVSDRERKGLLDRFRDAEGVYFAKGDALKQVEGIRPAGLEALLDKNLDEAEQILIRCANGKISLLDINDPSYPARLRSIPDPPVVLYYKGYLPRFGRVPAIGVVGTRRATPYGLSAAGRLGYQIARCGGCVISGCAKGIDTLALEGAVKGHGTVAGVLGCGVDVVYPAENRTLYEMVRQHGCLISEFPPGTRPNKWNFPRRNRIISGLGDGVLVVEAPERSGALITARMAVEQGRDLFVAPGNIGVAACAGSNALLRDGAVMVQSGWDVIGEYREIYPDAVVRFDGGPETESAMEISQNGAAAHPEKPVNPGEKKKVIDNSPASPYIDGEKQYDDLTGQEKTIVTLLRQGPCVTDALLEQLGGNSAQTLSTLTMMEVKGIIRRLPGNQLALK